MNLAVIQGFVLAECLHRIKHGTIRKKNLQQTLGQTARSMRHHAVPTHLRAQSLRQLLRHALHRIVFHRDDIYVSIRRQRPHTSGASHTHILAQLRQRTIAAIPHRHIVPRPLQGAQQMAGHIAGTENHNLQTLLSHPATIY